MSDPQQPNEPASANPQPRPTGPRTERGKRKSRQNARLHGLTAKLPDGEAEAKLMTQFADTWLEQLGALTDAEAALIRSSAIAYARLERCQKLDEAHLRTGPQAAVDAWMRKKRHAVRRLAQDLVKDPYNTVADLESSSFGCEWLMRHWLRIDSILAQGVYLTLQTMPMVLRLFGYLAEPPGPDADPTAIRLWHLACLCAGSREPSPPPGMPVHPVPARAELRRLIASELDRLEALRDDLWQREDGPDAELVAQLGLIDTSKAGQLRQRYQREAYSQMHRGINQLLRLRVERSKEQDRLWYQEHPHLAPRKRVPRTPSTGIGLPNVAPTPSEEADPSSLAEVASSLLAEGAPIATPASMAEAISGLLAESAPAPSVASPASVPRDEIARTGAAPSNTLPNEAAPPASTSPEPARTADSRNEPPDDAPEAQDDRLNPNTGNNLRKPDAIGAFLARSRTEPDRTAISPRPDHASTPSAPPAEAPDHPGLAPDRA